MDVVFGILISFWSVLGAMAPYLLFGFLVAGLLSVFISPETVERHLGGRGIWPVLKAAAFGVPLPLCSCGVIPVSASLRRHGASRGATTAFLLSTPQTGVDSIFVTWSLLGPVYAVFRPFVALISGILGGAVVSVLDRDGREEGAHAVHCTDECCAPGKGSGGRLKRAMRYGFVTLPRDIAKALLVGLVIAALITALVPPGFFEEHMGTGILPILVMIGVGIPMYICATASVPVAAAAIVAGVSPGAALAFLMTGPATNAASLATIWKIMGPRTAIIYLLVVVVSAIGAGLALDQIISQPEAKDYVKLAIVHQHDAGAWQTWFRSISAVVLVGVLARAVFKPSLGRLAGPTEMPEAEQDLAMVVTGMTCSHCAAAVTRALVEQPGVVSATVDLDAGRAVVRGNSLDRAALCRAVEDIGYRASVAEKSAQNQKEEEQHGEEH